MSWGEFNNPKKYVCYFCNNFVGLKSGQQAISFYILVPFNRRGWKAMNHKEIL